MTSHLVGASIQNGTDGQGMLESDDGDDASRRARIAAVGWGLLLVVATAYLCYTVRKKGPGREHCCQNPFSNVLPRRTAHDQRTDEEHSTAHAAAAPPEMVPPTSRRTFDLRLVAPDDRGQLAPGDPCAVCMDSLFSDPEECATGGQPDRTVVRLHPCGHVFHRDCAMRWLSLSLGQPGSGSRADSGTCPTCRATVNEGSQPAMP